MGMFDFGHSDANKYFEEAQREYEKYAQQSRGEIGKYREEGRSDLLSSRDKALSYQDPYLAAGKESTAALMDSLGIGTGARGQQGVYDKFTTSPGYQFALKQAQDSIAASNAAKGLTGSGAEQLALQREAQGMAEQTWDKYLTNYQNRLSELSGLGQRSALASSDISAQSGRDLSRLGFDYTNMDVGVLQGMAKSAAEAKMAAGAARSQENQSMWGAVGSAFGGSLSFI